MPNAWMLIGFIAAVASNRGMALVSDRSANPITGSELNESSTNGVPSDNISTVRLDVASGPKTPLKRVDEGDHGANGSGVVFLTLNSERNISQDGRFVEESEDPRRKKDQERSTSVANDSSLPRNVVLLLVDETSRDEVVSPTNFKDIVDFSVQGFLRTCRREENVSAEVDHSGEGTILEPDECHCDHFLRANIGGLVTWARYANLMTIGTVSSTNFTLPDVLGYATSTGIPEKFQISDDNHSAKRDARNLKSELNDSWHVVDLDRQPGFVFSRSPASRIDGIENVDGAWNIFDTLAKIRVAFFRMILDVLGGNLDSRDDAFAPRKSCSLRPNILELVGDAVKELKSVSHEKGYVLVAAISENDLSRTLELLIREISPEDTMLVVAGICAADKKPVAFYANGPGAKSLYETRNIWDLPGAIKDALTGGCRGSECKDQRHDVPLLTRPTIDAMSIDNDVGISDFGGVRDEKTKASITR